MIEQKTLHDGIFYFKNVVSNPDEVISLLEDNQPSQITPWKTWVASNNSKIIYGQYREGYFSNIRHGTNLESKISEAMSAIFWNVFDCVEKYNKVFGFSVNYNDQFFIRKYNPTVAMGPHADSDDETAEIHPVVSAVLYLNNNYDGGELEFPDHKLIIKPEPGSLVVFKSTYMHNPKPSFNGYKYMIPLFFNKKEL